MFFDGTVTEPENAWVCARSSSSPRGAPTVTPRPLPEVTARGMRPCAYGAGFQPDGHPEPPAKNETVPEGTPSSGGPLLAPLFVMRIGIAPNASSTKSNGAVNRIVIVDRLRAYPDGRTRTTFSTRVAMT